MFSMVVGLSRFHRRPSLAPMLLTKLLALSVAVPDLQRFARPEILTRDAIGQLRQQARLLGSPYGGWYCLPQLIDTSSLVYSFGIGTDLSWDVALIEETGTHVHAFDNTPVSNRWFNKVVRQGKIPRRMHFNLSLEQLQMLRTNLHRHAHLLGTRDGNMTMRLPTGFGESFVDEATGGARGFSAQPAWSAPALTLRSTMRKLHHEKEKIDILKLDVESAEFGLVGEWARRTLSQGQGPRMPASHRVARAARARPHSAGELGCSQAARHARRRGGRRPEATRAARAPSARVCRDTPRRAACVRGRQQLVAQPSLL